MKNVVKVEDRNSKLTKVEKVTFEVRTFSNGEVWASTSYGKYKSGAVGKDTFDSIANCANWANRMIAMRKKEGEKNAKKVKCSSSAKKTAKTVRKAKDRK